MRRRAARLFFALAVLAASGCGDRPHLRPPAAAPNSVRTRVFEAPDPSREERYCAWYGDARGSVLYFGLSPFWWAARRSGRAAADLDRSGPQLVGRFDLRAERFLPPLPTPAHHPRTGTWDVLAHPNGRIYFTAFFEVSGYVAPAGGPGRLFRRLGAGLNELALLPDGRLLATRYARSDSKAGGVVVFSPDGALEREFSLDPEEGVRVAPKSVAYDPVRRELWVTTDRIAGAGPVGHDTRVLDAASGRELLRLVQPEIQFVAFDREGHGYLAEREGGRLWLRILPPTTEGPPWPRGKRRLLDPAFPSSDFVQEIRPRSGSGAIVTRWSGRIHWVKEGGRVRTLALPRPTPVGLYYTAVRFGDRLCATYCSGVRVVCTSLR